MYRLAAAIVDLSLPVTSDSIDSTDSELSDLDNYNIRVPIGISTACCLEAELHEPALKIDC